MNELNEEAMDDLDRLEMLREMTPSELIFNHNLFSDRWNTMSDFCEELEDLMMEGDYENSPAFEGLSIAQGLVEDKMAEITMALEEMEIFIPSGIANNLRIED
jgi:hypothetical protein